MDRRTFFLSGAGTLLAQTPPSRTLNAGLIGAGGRGRFLVEVFKRVDPAVRVTAVCDVYEPNLEKGLSTAGPGASADRDYRRTLDRKDLDIVIIATPEHWHHRMFLDALSAGKDIYIEKPLCQTPEQGIEMIDAASRSSSIVQVGMQRRSYDLFQKAERIVQAGRLGAVRMVRSWWLNNGLGPAGGKFEGKLDWDQWQGPAESRVAPDPARFFNWRYFTDYSGGIMADQGAHVFDGIHMIMNAGFPSAVTAAAGRPHKPGVNTPESVIVAAEYPSDFVAVFTINYAAMRYEAKNDQLSSFDGDEARLDIGRFEYKVYRRGAEEIAAETGTSAYGFFRATDYHVENFLACVRDRKTPTATLEKGFQAVLVTQMGNLSLKHGRRIRWSAAERKVEW